MKIPRSTILLVFLISLVNLACAQPEPEELNFQNFSEAADNAKLSGKKMLVFVYTDTCPWCRKLLDSTYTDVEVIKYLNNKYELAKINAVADTPVEYADMAFTEAQLAAALKAQGYPTHIVMEVGPEKLNYIQQIPGYRDRDEFLQIIRYFGEDAFKTKTFDEFSRS